MPIIVVVSSTSSRTTTSSSSKQQHRHNDNKLSQIKHVLLMKDCYIIYHPTSFKHITKQHLHILIISDITYISSDVTGQAWHRFEDTGVSLDKHYSATSLGNTDVDYVNRGCTSLQHGNTDVDYVNRGCTSLQHGNTDVDYMNRGCTSLQHGNADCVILKYIRWP